MKIFDKKTTSLLFIEILDAMPKEKAPEFTESVKALFDKKNMSEDGTYDEYKVTSKDLMDLSLEYNKTAHG